MIVSSYIGLTAHSICLLMCDGSSCIYILRRTMKINILLTHNFLEKGMKKQNDQKKKISSTIDATQP